MSNSVPNVAPGHRGRQHLRRLRTARERGSLQRRGRRAASPGLTPRSGGAPRRSRILKGLAPLVVIALILLVGRRYALQTLDIERQVRQVLIPQLEKQYGLKIEVGAIYSNWFSQVRLNDIVINRGDAGNPLGALAQVKAVTVSLDLVGLAFRGKKPIQAVERVEVDDPQLYVQRDKAGKINILKILERQPAGPAGPRFAGVVVVRNARVWLDDLGVRSASGRYLRIDLQGGSGEIHGHGDDPLTFNLALRRALIGPDQATIENVKTQGEAEVTGKWLAAGVQLPSAPLPILADYAFPKREVVFASGSVGAVAQVAYDKSLPVLDQWTAAGDVKLRDVTGYAVAVREPDTGQPLRINNLNGAVTFNNRTATLQNVTLTALNTPLRVSGTAGLLGTTSAPQKPVADITVQSNAFDTPRLWRLAQFFTRNNAQFKGLDLATGRAAGFAHITGDMQHAIINADLALPATKVRHPQFGAAGLKSVRALINAEGGLADLKVNARIAARDLRLDNPKFGGVRAGALDAIFQMAGPPQGARVAGDIKVTDYAVQEPRYGRVVGRAARIIASSRNALREPWSGTVEFTGVDARGVDLKALSPDAAREIKDIGLVRGSARFAGLSATTLPTVRGTVQMSGVTVRDLRFTDLRTDLSFADGRLRLANARTESEVGPLIAAVDADIKTRLFKLSLTAPRALLPADRLNPYLAPHGLALRGLAVGRLTVTSNSDAPMAFDTSFDMSAPDAVVRSLPRAGQGFSRLQVRGVHMLGGGTLRLGDNNAVDFTGTTTVGVEEISATHTGPAVTALNIPSELSGARAVGVKVVLRGGVNTHGGDFDPQAGGTFTIERVAVPLPGAAGGEDEDTGSAVVREISGTILAKGRTVQAPRLFARLAGGEVTGHVVLGDDNTVTGEALAERLDLAELQRLAQKAGVMLPPGLGVRGKAFTRVAFNGRPADLQAKVETRLYETSVRYQGTTIPIDVARASFALQLPDLKSVPISDATLWTRGGRIHVNGNVTRLDNDFALDLDTTLAGVRARDIALTPALATLQQQANLDGLIKGELHIGGTATRPEINGRTGLDAAQVYGLSINNVATAVEARMTDSGPVVALTDLKGSADGTPFTAAVNVDFPAGTWDVKYNCPGLPAQRLLTAASQVAATLRTSGTSGTRAMTSAEEEQQLRELPIRGTLKADVTLNGTLPSPDGTREFAPQNGSIKISTDEMRWRALPLGRLTADLQVVEGAVEAKTFELRRTLGAVATDDDEDKATVRKPGADNAAVAAAPNAPTDAVLKVSGSLPLALDDPRLDAQITAENQHLAFYLDAADEVQRTLTRMGRPQPLLASALNIRKSLRGLDGRLDMTASLLGQWSLPIVGVSELTVRDNRAYGQFGELHVLPNVKAAFDVFKNKITIQQAELRQVAANPDDNDTVLAFEPLGQITLGGEIILKAGVTYADVSQLAPWVPALRDQFGQPVVSGNISDFTFSISGTTIKPLVRGSMLAENLRYQGYTLDFLRISRFDINDNALTIERNGLTIKKDKFQSNLAWGTIPWSWQTPGPIMDAPIDVHLLLETPADFNALAGVVVPAITKVDAEVFNASVDVTGTLQKRLVKGVLKLKNATFRADPAAIPVDIGVQKLSGTVNIGYSDDEQRVTIDPEDYIRGELVQASRIDAPTVTNLTAAERNPKAARVVAAKPPTIAGTFALRGDVHKDLKTNVQSPADFRYNLRFAVEHGAFATDDFSGFQDVNVGLQWRTTPGREDTERFSQVVSWMLSAKGKAAAKKQTPGSITSVGALRLTPDFASGPAALLRSRAIPFTQGNDFKDLAVHGTMPAADLQQARSNVRIDNLFLNLRNIGSGVIDGDLVLDNQAPAPRQIDETPTQPRLALNTRLSAMRHGRDRNMLVKETRPDPAAPAQDGDLEPGALREVAQPRRTKANTAAKPGSTTRARVPGRRIQSDELEEEPPDIEPPATGELPLRLAGLLTVSQVQFLGTPAAGAAGGAIELPTAPILDIQVALGQKVAFSTSNLNVELGGTLYVSGTPRDPVIDGTVETRSGFVRFPNASARITQGSVTLLVRRGGVNNEIAPRAYIKAVAEGQSGEYSVTLTLSGQLDLGSSSTQGLTVGVVTSPAIGSQEAALKQIMGTTNPDKNALFGVGTSTIFGSVEQSIARLFGLDSLVVEYRLNAPLHIQAGKRFGDKVYVTYRHRVSGDSTQTGSNLKEGEEYSLRIDYRLPANTKLGLHIDKTNNESRKRITLERTWQF